MGCVMFYFRKYQRLEGEATCQGLLKRLAVTSDTEQLTEWISHKDDSIDQLLRLKLQARTLAWRRFSNMYLGNLAKAVSSSHEDCLICLK